MSNTVERNAYQQLLEGIADHALFMLDTEGCISMWPKTAQQFYGYDSRGAVGHRLDMLFAEEQGEPPPLEDLLAEAKGGPVEIDNWHDRADGSVFWGTCTLSPLSNGEFDGYAVIVQDTTTRKQYERMLERQNDRLKEFTDILSHDLRNPLNILRGHLNQYKRTGDEKHLAVIDSTTDRMERLVEDLLRVARQGQVVEHPEPTTIGSVLDIASEGTLPVTATLRYDSVPTVMADSDRLVQVFENLLRNSVEHSGDNVIVRVGPLRDGFYVEDDGPGIPDGDRERVFDHGYTTREDGNGYGLSVVRSIVGAHGWDVSVVAADHGGARFEITGIEFVDGE
ncbi:two-component system sensor histidine kinase NtrB [Haloplanus aerogenes]|uniref:histidine kinase n=1 Tax=Haloplanus aerogenes TaxID=660522 RepID=A0A3M0DP39_9EURY|nr:PAS domain-containing sensor histidine kinase [Haloplanus aerogenes]AZH24699.1 PAS domain-containing sensor histidine kinase [Haloplanus aerogenes]RMB23641.1 PAS domain S-box-containing protein [Haloplanus aerogenes]